MALVFLTLEEDFDKMRRRQHELGGRMDRCARYRHVEVSRCPQS